MRQLLAGRELVPPAVRVDQLLCHRGLRTGEHLVDRAHLRDAAGIDDRHALADLLDDRHLMRDDDDRDAERFVDLPQQREDRPRGRRVECARGLVAQQDLRVCRQRAGDRHTLLLAARKLGRVIVRAVTQADGLEQLARPLLRVRLFDARDLEREADILQRRALLQQVKLLEDHAHRAARLEQLLFGQLAQLLPVHGHRALGRRLQKVDAAHKRTFARARQADDAEDLAAADVQIHAVQRNHRTRPAAEGFIQVSNTNDVILFQAHSPFFKIKAESRVCFPLAFHVNHCAPPHDKRPATASQPQGRVAEKRAKPHIMHISFRMTCIAASSFSYSLGRILSLCY